MNYRLDAFHMAPRAVKTGGEGDMPMQLKAFRWTLRKAGNGNRHARHVGQKRYIVTGIGMSR